MCVRWVCGARAVVHVHDVRAIVHGVCAMVHGVCVCAMVCGMYYSIKHTCLSCVHMAMHYVLANLRYTGMQCALYMDT